MQLQCKNIPSVFNFIVFRFELLFIFIWYNLHKSTSKIIFQVFYFFFIFFLRYLWYFSLLWIREFLFIILKFFERKFYSKFWQIFSFQNNFTRIKWYMHTKSMWGKLFRKMDDISMNKIARKYFVIFLFCLWFFVLVFFWSLIHANEFWQYEFVRVFYFEFLQKYQENVFRDTHYWSY